jgi:hypothetical protein
MQDLLNTLEKTINESVKQFVSRIVEKYDNTDEDALMELWTSASKSTKSTKAKKSDKPNETGSSQNGEAGCQYKPTKGKNAGQICGVKPKAGGVYCATHKKYEGQEPKEKKVIPEPKKGKSKTSPPTKNVQRVVRTHKTLNKLYHPDTDLVFKSAQDRVVIGKIVENKVKDLTEEDIDVCKQWGFQYEKDGEKSSSKTKTDKEDSDDEEVKPNKPSAKSTKKSEKAKEDSDDEDEKPNKSSVKPDKKAKTTVTGSDKEEKSAKKPKKVVTAKEDSDDEEEKPSKKPSKTEKSVKPSKPEKPVEKKKVKVEEDSEEDSEDEKKPAKHDKADKKKKSKPSVDTEELIEDLDAAETVVKKALGIKQDEEVEEELEDDE